MWRAFGLGVLLDLAVASGHLRAVADGAMLNPDSFMRLVRLRDILAAGAPLHAVARDGSGKGTVLAWSHLLDSLLLLLAWPLHVALDGDAALRWAAIASGPLCVGGLCAALAWAFAPLTERGWRWIVAVPTCISLPIVGYGLPGVLHHHVLLALCCVMVAGWAARGPTAGAAAGERAGAWAAAGLWLSPETMPFILMAFCGLVLAGTAPNVRSRSNEAAGGFGAATLLAVCAIVAADPPAGGMFAGEIDRVSVVYVAMAAAMLGGGGALCAFGPSRGGAAAALLLGLWVAAFPRLLAGPEGVLAPEQARAMFGIIGEMQPVASVAWAGALTVPGALGAAAVLCLALRRRTVLWGYAAACALVLVGLGVLHARFSIYGATLGAGMLPVVLTHARDVSHTSVRRRLALIALFVLAPQAVQFAAAGDAGQDVPPECAVAAAVPLLAPFAGEIVLAAPGDTPELLYRTGVLTVGSFYHRNAQAFMRLRAAWRSGASAGVADAVRRTGATAILVCPGGHAGGPRSRLVEDLPDGTLADRLDRGEVPDWLEFSGKARGFVVYRVRGVPDRAR